MAINYCTISSSSIDSFCGARRAIVFNRLVSQLHPTVRTVGGNPAHVATKIPALRPREREEMRYEKPTELDKILVSANINGISGSELQNYNQRLDLVFITNLKNVSQSINVNISNISVN